MSVAGRIACYHGAMVRPVGPEDETQLAESMRRGEKRAFDTLLHAYGPEVLAIAGRLLLRDDEAAEVVRETFARAYRERSSYSSTTRLSTWLQRLALELAVARVRAQPRTSEEPLEDLLPRFLPTGQHVRTFQPWADPATRLDQPATVAFVVKQIRRIPRSYRAVLLLRDVVGITTDEVAEIMGLTPNAVRIRLHRSRLALRTLLAPHFEEVES